MDFHKLPSPDLMSTFSPWSRDGKQFLLGRIVNGSTKRLICLDAANGKELWSLPIRVFTSGRGLGPGGITVFKNMMLVKYDLAVYLLQGPPRKPKGEPPSHVPIRVSVLHVPLGKKLHQAEMIARRMVSVPAKGEFHGFEVAAKPDSAKGNVVLLPGIEADENGCFQLTIKMNNPKDNGDDRWGETLLAGVQIRVSR